MQHAFDIYSFRITFVGHSDEDNDEQEHDATMLNNSKSMEVEANAGNHHLDPSPIVPIRAHPDDSVSDLKRHIQSCYAKSWGLSDRRLDRDGLYLGWELVHRKFVDGRNNEDEASVLSYHLFLHSYNVREGDILHAVVRKEQ